LARQLGEWRKNITVKIYDGSINSVEDIISKLRDFEPDIVGLSALCGNYEAGKEILKNCRCSGSDTVTVVGNHHANYLCDILSRLEKDIFPEIDFIVTGNQDISVLKPLFEKIEAGETDFEKISNLCFRKNGKWIPVPMSAIQYKNDARATPDLKYIDDFDKYFDNYRRVFSHFHPNLSGIKALNINFVKGCMQGCKSSCIYCCLKDHKFKYFKNPGQFWNNIQSLYHQGFNLFFETANSFTSLSKIKSAVKVNYLEELASVMPRALKDNIQFMVYAKADELTEKNIQLLKDINVIRVVIGLDSADEKVLRKGINKRHVTEGMNYHVAKLLKDNDIQLYGCYVPGGIGETPYTLEKTKKEIQEIMRLGNCCTIEYTSLAPMPGSKAWELVKADFFNEKGISDIVKVEEIAKYWVEKTVTGVSWQMIEDIKGELRQEAKKLNVIFGGYY
jgi:radical SAM superfamily enzyme YgiQ (UPF0313 family)